MLNRRFLSPPPTGGLPAGYTQLDYVDGCGTTDYYPIASTSMELVFQGGQSTLGNSAGPNAGTDTFHPLDWDGTCEWWVFDGGYRSYALTTSGSYLNASDYAQSQFGAIGSVKRTFRTWGLGASLDTTLSWSSSEVLIIGAGRVYNSSSSKVEFTPRSISGLRVYSCTVWEGDACVRHYIPCLSSDGAYGMYDVVGGKFVIFRKANPLTLTTRYEELPALGGGAIITSYAKLTSKTPVTSDLTITATDYDDYHNPFTVTFTITSGATESSRVPWDASSDWNPIYSISKEYDDFYYYMTPLRWHDELL